MKLSMFSVPPEKPVGSCTTVLHVLAVFVLFGLPNHTEASSRADTIFLSLYRHGFCVVADVCPVLSGSWLNECISWLQKG